MLESTCLIFKAIQGDLEKAVRAYHAGEGNVQKVKVLARITTNTGRIIKAIWLVLTAIQLGILPLRDLINYFKTLQNGRRSG